MTTDNTDHTGVDLYWVAICTEENYTSVNYEYTEYY